MIKIFIELINNFLSDGIYLSGLKEEVLRLVRAEHNSMLAWKHRAEFEGKKMLALVKY